MVVVLAALGGLSLVGILRLLRALLPWLVLSWPSSVSNFLGILSVIFVALARGEFDQAAKAN